MLLFSCISMYSLQMLLAVPGGRCDGNASLQQSVQSFCWILSYYRDLFSFFFEWKQEPRKHERDHRNRNRQWGMSCYHLSLLVLLNHLKITEKKNTHALACIPLLFLYSSKLTDQNVQNPVIEPLMTGMF